MERRNHRRTTHYVEERAKVATASKPETVRALVDEAFNGSLAAGASESLRDRIFRADLDARQGNHPLITEADIANAINEFASMYPVPDFARTNVEQVHLFRRAIRQLIPHFGAEDGVPRYMSAEMTPTEAMYLSVSLLTQKMHNETFQVPPEQWVETYRNPSRDVKPLKPEATIVRIPDDVARLGAALERDLANDSSEVVWAAHRFLDLLRLAR